MNWSKVKIFLIIFLLVLNVLLFVKLSETYSLSERLPEEILAEASENLLYRGIKISPEVIDGNRYSKDIYTIPVRKLTADRLSELSDESHYEKAFHALLGTREHTVRYFDIPDGVSATVADPLGEVLGVAAITNDFGVEYYIPGIDTGKMTELYEAHKIDRDSSPSGTAKKAINGFFSAVYADSLLSYESDFSYDYDDGEMVGCTLTLESLPLCDMSLCFYIKNGEIVYFKGSLPEGDVKAQYHNELIDGVNILFYLDGEERVEITSQSLSYCTVKFDSESYLAVPAWCFTEKKADGTLSHKVYDAVAGTRLK